MNTLKRYKTMVRSSDACDKGLDSALACSSLKQLLDYALSAEAMPWVARAIACGYFAKDMVKADFAAFLRAGYVRDADGYTSAMFIGDPTVRVSTTSALIIGCAEVNVERPLSELHIIEPTKIHVQTKAIVYTYYPDGTNKKDLIYGS